MSDGMTMREYEQALRERALRWEALARQLGDALESLAAIFEEEAASGFRLGTDARAALSVYRDAIKEDR